MAKRGSRAQVMHGTAEKTKGNLRKKDLKYTPEGKIISVHRSNNAKKNPFLRRYQKSLVQARLDLGLPNNVFPLGPHKKGKSRRLGTPKQRHELHARAMRLAKQ